MTKCTNIYPSSLGLCHTYVFYDQFMNKTHVEGVQNICSFPYCYPFKLKIVVKRQMIIIYEKYSTSSNWYFSMTFTDFPRQNVFFQANITFHDFSRQGWNSMTFQGLCMWTMFNTSWYTYFMVYWFNILCEISKGTFWNFTQNITPQSMHFTSFYFCVWFTISSNWRGSSILLEYQIIRNHDMKGPC